MKKTKNGYYRATKVIDGKQKTFYGKTRREALDKMDNFIQKKESVLFRDVAEDWWEHLSLAYNTLRGYRPSFERAVDIFGKDSVTEIRRNDIMKVISELADKDYSDKTVRTQLSVLNLIFRHGINFMGIDMTNPARDITVPKNLNKKKVSIPADEDIKKVKAAVNEPFGLFAYMLLYTGLRRGEVLALRWEDIQDGFIKVDKTLYYIGNTPYVKSPKTEKGTRRIPVLDALSPFITGKKGIIFNHKGKYLPYHVFLRNWYSYCENTKIKCTPHQLRHCFATMLYENGISPKDAQHLLGHAQISTTMDIYTDIREAREEHLKSIVKSIDMV